MDCADCFNIFYYFVTPCLVVYLLSQYLWKKFTPGTSEEQIPERNEEITKASSNLTEPSGDVVDYPTDIQLKTALDRVSKAIYTSYVAVWLKAPEEIKSQPLHKAINKAVFDIYDNAQRKTQHIDSCKIIVIIINALTKHLTTFRKSEATATKKNRQDVVKFLRQQTQSLLACLLPDSLGDSIYLMPFLTELVAISVLETTFDYLANPSFINQLIVNKINNLPKAATGEATENEHLETDSGISRALAAASHGRKRHGTAKSSGSTFRSLKVGREHRDVSDSSNVDADSSDSEMSLLDACRKQWAKEDWTATISKLDNESFEIEITINYDGLGPAGWITVRSMDDLGRLCAALSEHVDLKEHQVAKTPEDDSSSTSDSICIKSPESFIETVVTQIKENLNTECMFFLSPFPYDEEARHLFRDIDSEELSTDGSSSDTADLCHDGISEDVGISFRGLRRKLPSTRDKKESQPSRSVENKGSPSPNPPARDGDSQPMLNYMRLNQSIDTNYDVVGHSFDPQQMEEQGKENLIKKVQKAVLDLADEVTDSKLLVKIAIKFRAESIKNVVAVNLPCVQQMFSGTEIAKYLDHISDLIEGPEAAPLPPLDPLRADTLEAIKKLQRSELKGRGWVLSFLANVIGVNALPRVIHNAFQNSVANKKMLFELLKDLVKLIIDEAQQTKQGSVSNS